ncbi:MAG: sialidase family protein [Vicinamibacterales bacterium]
MKLPMLLVVGLLMSAGWAMGLSGKAPGTALSEWRPSIAAIASPAADASGQPQTTVSSRGVLLSWVERSGARANLKFAERTPSGWSDARTVAAGDDWFVNWADVPSVLRLDDGSLAAHWLQKSGRDTYAYDVRLAHSNDDGRTWSPSFLPHHDGTKQEHGFASLFQMPGAGLGLIWLDGRNMASAAGHDSHGSTAGAMSVYAGAFDRSWKQTVETPVDSRVCECCPTAATVTSEGPIVAYRNRSDDEIRDIYVARLENGRWTEPVPVHNDGWKIAACPVNGPMLSARGRDVVLAWFAVKDDVGHAYLSFSRDAGKSFGQPIRLDETSAIGRVDVALLPDGSAAATWIEFAAQQSSFTLRRVAPSGEKSPLVSITAIDGGRASGYPRIAYSGEELVFAWTGSRNGIQKVSTAIARLQSETR